MTANAMKKKDFKKLISNSKEAISNSTLVLKESLSEFKDMGCILPSSPWVGEGLVEVLNTTDSTPRKIVEVGAGVGPITVKIMDKMTAFDTLVVNELNGKFLDQLKERIKTHPKYDELKASISFFEGPIQDLPSEDAHFDYIICSLPFNNFPKDLVKSIFEKLFAISTKEALMTYYEYVLIRNISKKVSPNERRQRISEMSQYIDNIVQKKKISKKIIWRNIMPINVYTLKINS